MGMLLRRYYGVAQKAAPVFETKETVVETVETAEIAEEQAVTEAPQYSKSDISRMNVADLKKLAPTLGIAVTEESTGAQLKREIIAKLGL